MTTCSKTIQNRLKRAEGQLRGIQNMITEEKSCVEVVTQLTAVRSSVDRLIGIIIAENLKDCLENPAVDQAEQAAKIEQAVNLIIKK